MTGKWTLPLAALAFSLTVTPFSAFAAEGDAPPPPGEQQRPEELPPPPGDRRRPGKPLPRPGRERRGPGLSEEQRMKLEELNRRIAEALAAYRAEPNDSTKAALKERITERFELQQMFAIERVEKMLARERERLENKDQEIDRQLERLLRPSREKPQGPPRAEHMRPEERRRPDGKRPEPGRREARGPFGKVLTPEEGREAREITLALLKAEAVTPDERDSALELLQDSQRQTIIRELLAQMRPDESLMLTLFYLEECSIEEIHQITSLSNVNIKTKLHRARKHLYEQLKARMGKETNELL